MSKSASKGLRVIGSREWVGLFDLEVEDERKLQTEGLESLLREIRIRAGTEIITKPRGQTIADVIHRGSAHADLVFLGLQDPKAGAEDEYARRMETLAEGLNTTVFVRNAGQFAGKLV